MFKAHKGAKQVEIAIQNQAALDKDQFKAFLATSLLHELKNKKGCMVLGRMGAGKSTFISIQQGAIYEMDDEGEYKFKGVPKGVYIPKTSSGFQSQTLNVGVFVDTRTNMMYFDTAGLNENRGHNVHTWTTFSTSMALSLLNQVHGVVVVLNYTSSFGERGAGFAQLAQCLENVIGPGAANQCFYKNMIFVITGAYMGANQIKVGRVKNDAKLILEAAENKRDQIEKRLKAGDGKSADGSDKSQQDSADLRETEAQIRLVQALSEADENRILMSFPDGMEKCHWQRAKVIDMIQKSTPIGHRQLLDVVNGRQTCTFEVLKTLSYIAVESHDNCLKKFNNMMEDMLKAIEEDQSKLKSIEDDWQKTLKTMTDEVVKELNDVQKGIDSDRKSAEDLRGSKKRCLFKELQVRQDKSGWFRKWVDYTYPYTGEWYHEMDIEWIKKEQEYTTKILVDQRGNNDQQETKLQIHMVSNSGQDMHVNINLYREEKDIPETQNRIKVYKDREEEAKKKEKVLQEKKTSLQSLNNQEGLVQYVLNTKNDNKKNLLEIFEKLNSPDGNAASISNAARAGVEIHTFKDVMTGLYRLLSTMDRGLSAWKNLSRSASDNLNEFVKEHNKAIELQRKASKMPAFKKFMEKDAEEFAIGDGGGHREVEEPGAENPAIAQANKDLEEIEVKEQENKKEQDVLQIKKDELESLKRKYKQLEEEFNAERAAIKDLEMDLEDLEEDLDTAVSKGYAPQ